MSNSDSFIDEVTEEVRRDRLFGLLRRYGWVAVLAVLLLVGGATWREVQKARAIAQAEAFGDAVLAALQSDEPAARADALAALDVLPGADAAAMRALLLAAELAEAGEAAQAVARLQAVASDGEVSEIYRQIASFKALTAGTGTLPVDERRLGFEALSVPGQPLRLLAEEQLALIEIETGETAAALTRLQRLLSDAEITPGLRRRAAQLIVALGGRPEAA